MSDKEKINQLKEYISLLERVNVLSSIEASSVEVASILLCEKLSVNAKINILKSNECISKHIEHTKDKLKYIDRLTPVFD